MEQLNIYLNALTPQMLAGVLALTSLCAAALAASIWFNWAAPKIRRRRLRALLPHLQQAATHTESLLESAGAITDTSASTRLMAVTKQHIALTHCAAQAAKAAAQVTIPLLSPPAADETDQRMLSRVAHLLAQPEISLLAAAGDGAAAAVWLTLGNADLELLEKAAGSLQESGIPSLLLHGYPTDIAQELLTNAGEIALHSIQEHGLSLPHIMEDLRTRIDESLEHIGQARDHLEGALESFSPADIHMQIPVITLLTSSIREIDLLANDRTSIERSIGHIALDAGAVAGGAFAGGKLGAVIGSFIAPGIGTAIGGAIGGILGGMGGRSAANHVKMAPLHEAIATYRSRAADAATGQHTAATHLVTQLRAATATASASWGMARDSLIAHSNHILSSETYPSELDRLVRARTDFQRLTQQQITSIKLNLSRHRPQTPGILRLHPQPEYDAQAQKILAHLEALGATLIPLDLPPHPLDALHHLAGAGWPRMLLPHLDASADRLTGALRTLSHQLYRAEQEATAAYRQSVRHILSTSEDETNRYKNKIDTHNKQVSSSITEIKRHKAALGLT